MSEKKSQLQIEFKNHRLVAEEHIPKSTKESEPRFTELIGKIDELHAKSELETERKLSKILARIGYASTDQNRAKGRDAAEVRGELSEIEGDYPVESFIYYKNQLTLLDKTESHTQSPLYWKRMFENKLKAIESHLEDATHLKAMYYGGLETELLTLCGSLQNAEEKRLIELVINQLRSMVKNMKDSVLPNGGDLDDLNSASRALARSADRNIV